MLRTLKKVAVAPKAESTTTNKTFTIYDLINTEPSTRRFLDRIARNSKQTQKVYAAGLLAFQKFLAGRKTLSPPQSISSLTESLITETDKIDVYGLLDEFVSYLMDIKQPTTGFKLANNSIHNYMTAVKSYLEYYDVDIAVKRFKKKVVMPTIYREDEEALDAADIRKIMLSCNNRRLKPYLLILASAGLRAVEACAIRVCDIDYTSSPTKVHVRKEYCKTKTARDVYISDEATSFLKQWLKWKYRERKAPYRYKHRIVKIEPHDTDLVFTHHHREPDPRGIYTKILVEYSKLLESVGFDKRKEGMLRRTITLHSFRRYVKTVISDQVSKDFSEWFLGHAKSPYYTMKESMRREIYQTKCMKYLTYLDYSALENTGRSIERQLESKDEELQNMKKEMLEQKQRQLSMDEKILQLKNALDKLTKVVV